jgi:hypothetical protein
MKRFAFFIYRFNGPIMRQAFSSPRNTFQIEQGVISMLAGDVFDSFKVWIRILAFKFVYRVLSLRNWGSWNADRHYRLAQAHAQFTGGTTPLDKE